MKRIAILILATGLIAAPALAQQQQPKQPLPPQVLPKPDAKTFAQPREVRRLQPAIPCDATRGRIIAEPEIAVGPRERLAPLVHPKPLDPLAERGQICPVSPAS